jgi:hypothetical protein
LLGAFFVGHGEAVAILMTLGIGSLFVAVVLCAVPIVLIDRVRSRDMIREWELQQKQLKGD